MGQSAWEVTMRDQIIIVAILGMSLLSATSGEDRNDKGNQTMRGILAIPLDKLFPGSSALQDIEGQTNLLSDVCQRWTAGDTPEKRIRLLRFAVELGKCQSKAKRSHFQLSDDRIAKALLQALDDETQCIRSAASDLFEKEFDKQTVQRFGPQIVEITRKRKNTDAILLLGRTEIKEAESMLQEDKTFRAASEKTTEMALARLGNKEYEAKFIGEFKSTKHPGDKLRFAQDLAYVATENACKALAEELRTPEKVEAGGLYSLRVFIIDALSMTYPDEHVLQRPAPLVPPRDDSYYQEVEKWAEEKFGISWNRPRPPFFYMIPVAIKGPTSIR